MFYSNGKLLLTGEYLVLDGAKALAVPTKFGQSLEVNPLETQQLIWASFTHTGICWFEAVFDLKKLRLINATFSSEADGNADNIAETLLEILIAAKKLNPNFLKTENGFVVKTNLSFPQNWGLGSSSTLINSIAHWAKVDAFELLWNSFKGSGYDIACAQNNSPIFYQLENQKPRVEPVKFHPSFKDDLFFVHLNQKQNSKEGIARYREKRQSIKKELLAISELSDAFLAAEKITDLEAVMAAHEQLISSIIELPPIKSTHFSDYFGAIKSLGAWGGDFILATGNKDTPTYFKEKGFETVISYSKMVL